MKKNILNKLISTVLAAVMLVTAPAVLVYADGEAGAGKYVSDVFIAYGKTQEDAVKWLTDNGWEPIKGDNDFCAGKDSYWDDSISAAMGIKRTNNPNDAITDMAVMNMTGGYSFPAYEELLEQKRADIDELISRLMDIIYEYRDNYNGNGSAFGQKRAAMVHDILNRFYDGEPGSEFAVNDTGLPLGDLLLAPMLHETGETGGDLNQILLESSGPAMLAVEVLLSLAADPNETTWLERLAELSEDTIAENIGDYVPSAAGQNLPVSAIQNLLQQEYGTAAEKLSADWTDIHEKMRWYENYNENNGLWQADGEDDAAYTERINAHFGALKAADEDLYNETVREYEYDNTLYAGLYDIPYSGSWGETLGDFFNQDGIPETDSFLPMAAALSKGQKSALEYVSLSSLIMAGMQDEQALAQMMPNLNEIFGDNLQISIYTGVNRDIFRNGIALTSEALMEQNMGKGSAFDKIWDTTGIVAITSYCAAVVGAASLIAGAALVVKGKKLAASLPSEEMIELNRSAVQQVDALIAEQADSMISPTDVELLNNWKLKSKQAHKVLDDAANAPRMSMAGRVLLGVGGALLIGAAVVSAVQLYKYYQRHFTPIPRMIVSESDIVTWMTDENGQPLLDENGNQKKLIEFDQYEYYSAVKCNRPEVGKISDWQDGVSDYASHGCYDIADLNGDFGQEWLALYTVKSLNKGNPILADSLKLQYGSDAQPEGTSKCLHFFEYTYAMDMGDTAYSYNNKKGGIYFFWEEDAAAAAGVTASVFTIGSLAIAAAAGLVAGLAGTTLILYFRRKKKENAKAQ